MCGADGDVPTLVNGKVPVNNLGGSPGDACPVYSGEVAGEPGEATGFGTLRGAVRSCFDRTIFKKY